MEEEVQTTVTTSSPVPSMLRQDSFNNLNPTDAKIITAEPFRETLHRELHVRDFPATPKLGPFERESETECVRIERAGDREAPIARSEIGRRAAHLDVERAKPREQRLEPAVARPRRRWVHARARFVFFGAPTMAYALARGPRTPSWTFSVWNTNPRRFSRRR